MAHFESEQYYRDGERYTFLEDRYGKEKSAVQFDKSYLRVPEFILTGVLRSQHEFLLPKLKVRFHIYLTLEMVSIGGCFQNSETCLKPE